jgi:acetoin utilization deacetylase AcuC-like enzyme
MRIVFHQRFYDSDYSDDGSAVSGRMEAIVNVLKTNKQHIFIEPQKADMFDIQRAHKESYILSVKQKPKLYDMALLSAGAAIKAAELSLTGTPAMSINRPPGHHAYREMGWGYCHFSNLAIATLKLLNDNRISSALVIDIDAHTGDGTKDVLKDIKNVKIFNPMADTPKQYIDTIENYIKDIPPMDIIAVSAGFDNYEKDLGKKLRTFDFYNIGLILKNLSKKFGHNRRFAVLEGGYYLPDLGKNVEAFCGGFE